MDGLVLPCQSVEESACHHTHCVQGWVLHRLSEQGWDWVPRYQSPHVLGWVLRCRLGWGHCSSLLGLGWAYHWGHPCRGGRRDQEEQFHPGGFRGYYHKDCLDHGVLLGPDLTLVT